MIGGPVGRDARNDAGWVAFFRVGPSRCRTAYKKLLAELRTGDDPVAAMATFRASLDMDKIHALARKTLGSKLKRAKRR